METELIPNGVVLPQLPDSSGTLEKFGLNRDFYVLLVSRIVPEKRHLDLIAAFKRANLPDWKLVFVGGADQPDKYELEVIAKAAETGVVMTGFQRGLALQELYTHAGLFVLPSSHEGLPIAMLEALSYGLPVIASDIPANLEIGLDSENYFTLGDIAHLEDRLTLFTKLHHDPVEHHAIRKWVSEKYNWNKIAMKTLEVYQAIMNKSK